VTACAPGRATFSPASDPKLASQGWVEAHPVLSFNPSRHFTKSLVCKDPSCGGLGFVVAADEALPSNLAANYRLLMANPKLTDAKLLTAMQVTAATTPSLVAVNGQVVNVHKASGALNATLTCNKSFPTLGQLHCVARLVMTSDRVFIRLGGGPTPSKALERLRMAGG